MKKPICKALILSLFAAAAYAESAHQVVDLTVKHWLTSKAFTLEVLDKMPDSDFTFKASDAEMSFGEMGYHIAMANRSYCAASFGAEPPAKDKQDTSKAAVIKTVTESFDYCISGMQKLLDADLMKLVGKAPKQTTIYERFWGAFTHTAHHRAQLEVYLRLKGIQPPDYKF